MRVHTHKYLMVARARLSRRKMCNKKDSLAASTASTTIYTTSDAIKLYKRLFASIYIGINTHTRRICVYKAAYMRDKITTLSTVGQTYPQALLIVCNACADCTWWHPWHFESIYTHTHIYTYELFHLCNVQCRSNNIRAIDRHCRQDDDSHRERTFSLDIEK